MSRRDVILDQIHEETLKELGGPITSENSSLAMSIWFRIAEEKRDNFIAEGLDTSAKYLQKFIDMNITVS